MACKIRIISYYAQPFHANKNIFMTLLDKRDIILLQKTLMSGFNINELDGIMGNTEMS